MNALPRLETRHWWGLGLTLLVAFTILGFVGREVYRQAPPIPDRFVSDRGEVLFTQDDVLTGQQVWQSTGGQQLGSVWGHGAYQAPDWSADWLHREALALLDLWAEREHDQPYPGLGAEARAGLRERLKGELRSNTFDPTTSAAERPGQAITYTNNWPHEPLIDNRPSAANVVWSIVAHPDRGLLDRHRIPRRRALPGAGDRRTRAALPAPEGQRPVRGAPPGGGRLAGRAVLRRPPGAAPRSLLLARPPGLRIRGPGPGLADRSLRRAVALALPHAARAVAGPGSAGRHPHPGVHVRRRLGRHRPHVRRRLPLLRPHPPLGHGVLALVGHPPLGGGLPPPLLQRHPDSGHGGGSELLRSRGRPPGAHRPRGLAHEPARAGGALDGEVPLAHPLLAAVAPVPALDADAGGQPVPHRRRRAPRPSSGGSIPFPSRHSERGSSATSSWRRRPSSSPPGNPGEASPLLLAARLRVDHGAIAALLVPTPTPALVADLVSVLSPHNRREEHPGGAYEQCDAALGTAAAEALVAELRSFPDVPVMPHNDGPHVMTHVEENLERARRQWENTPLESDDPNSKVRPCATQS